MIVCALPCDRAGIHRLRVAGKMLTTATQSVSMKCHWRRRRSGAAVPLGIAGIYALRGRRKETTRFAAIVGATSASWQSCCPLVDRSSAIP